MRSLIHLRKKGDVEARGLVVTLDDNLAEAEAKRH